MKREIKSIIPNKDIIVLDIEINDEVINILRVHDDFDEQLNFVIRAYAAHIEDNEDIDIFEIGNTYLVTESVIYVAAYADEFEINAL